MKLALAVNYVGNDVSDNVRQMLALAEEAADAGAELVLFPEAATTGLINNDVPEHDLPLGVPIPGELTERFSAVARERGIWLGTGLFEREGERLYDTAVLIGPDGNIVLRYRRMSNGWHAPNANPDCYGEGSTVPVVKTPFGRLLFLICGDLFDIDLDLVRNQRPDYVLYPFARSMEGTWTQARWDAELATEYTRQVARTGTTFVMTNYISDEGYFGGACVVHGDGTVVHRRPLGMPGLLLADVI